MIETPAEILAHHASKRAADSFCAWRKAARKPLTETAALRIAATLMAINRAGGNADDALGMAEEHGWQTIKAEWYFGQLAREARACGHGHRPDAALEQIARVAGLETPSRYDRH